MASKKLDVAPSSSHRLLHPMHTVLVSSVGKDGQPNIMTVAWATPTSVNPPLIAISVRRSRHTYKLIQETGDFVVNIPTMEILDATLFCGRKSGKEHDKFKEASLTPLPARKVKSPIIKECVAFIECKVHSQFETGDHIMILGEVVDAYANKEAFTDRYNLKKAKMILHLGGNDFATLAPKVFKPKQ